MTSDPTSVPPMDDIYFCGPGWTERDRAVMREYLRGYLDHRSGTRNRELSSMTKYPDLFAALAAPFDDHEVKTLNKGGRLLSYVTARSLMNRLDSVVGPESWRDTYTETKDGLKCRLEIRLPDGEWIWKEDGGGFAGMSDEDDNEKTAFTSAFKRVCVKAGLGRYLYRDGVPDFARDQAAPASAPANGHAPAPAAHRPSQDHAPAQGNVPRSGKALFAWVKDQEQKHQLKILNPLNDWANQQGVEGRMVDWPEDFVAAAYAHALSLVRRVQPEPQSQEPAPVQRAGNWMLEKQRNKLADLIWKMAAINYHVPVEKATDQQFRDALTSLALAHPSGDVLADVANCTDTRLLAEYIELADERLALMNS